MRECSLLKKLGRKIMICCCGLILSTSVANAQDQGADLTVPVHPQVTALHRAPFTGVIVSWQPISKAVCYEFRIINPDTQEVLLDKKDIFATGYQVTEAELEKVVASTQNPQWQVRGLDIEHQPLGEFIESKPLLEGRYFNRYWEGLDNSDKTKTTPLDSENYLIENDVIIPPLKLTGDFAAMSHMPVYPVFSWVKVPGATKYIITVKKYTSPDKRTFDTVEEQEVGDTYDYYGKKSFASPGSYFYRIKALDDKNEKLAESPITYFQVGDKPVDIVALGDSITHGGGAISTPPSTLLYNWESYAALPIVNAGYSGDVTRNMVKRFSQDVVQYHPKIVVIMGGINDLREGTKAAQVIDNLSKLRDMAIKEGMIPVFLTITPMRPELMEKYINIKPVADWYQQTFQVNTWIKEQPNYVEVAMPLTDIQGLLRAEMTTDGLHPDVEGKKIIGERVGNYLREHFAYLWGNTPKE